MAGRRRIDGDPVAAAPPVAKWELAVLAVVAALFFGLRLPLFTPPGVLLGWNSDAAIFGLMARSIVAGHSFPIFFMGQSYMGPLTSWAAVGASLFTGGVGPLAVRLAASAETFGGIVFYCLTLRRLFGLPVASAVALWLASGPEYLVHFTTAPIGAEQVFLISGLMLWMASRDLLSSVREWFVFGVLAGFGWWMNQGVVFVICGVLATCVLRSRWWEEVRPHLQLARRLRLRYERLDIPSRIGLQAVNVALIANLAAAVAGDFGLDVPSLWIRYPIAEPLAALLLFHAGIALWIGRSAILWPPARTAAIFAAGACIGYAPVWVGGLFHAYVSKYHFSASLLSPGELATHVKAVWFDALLFCGWEGAPFAGLVVIAGFATALYRSRDRIAGLLLLHHRQYGARTMAALTMFAAAAFYLLSRRAHPGSMRYVVAALPLVYAFSVSELLRIRFAGPAVVVFVAVALFIPRLTQVRAVAAAHAEHYVIPGGFDPRPTLAAIHAAGYRVCYADYWISYKLEFLADDGTLFVPWRSLDRDPAESIRRAALPGVKCIVENSGAVRDLAPRDREGATSRSARASLRRRGRESEATRPPLE